MATHKRLCAFLKDARINSGLTQRDLSDSLGYTSPQYVSNWERGVSSPPMDKLYELVRLLKLNPEEILTILQADQEELVRRVLKIQRRRPQMAR